MPSNTTPEFNKSQYTRCYTIGHSWDDVDSNHWTTEWGEPFTVRCMRCGAERRDKIDSRTGDVLPGGRRYVYPEGYGYAKGTRPTRSDFRLTLLQQRIREARVARKKAAS